MAGVYGLVPRPSDHLRGNVEYCTQLISWRQAFSGTPWPACHCRSWLPRAATQIFRKYASSAGTSLWVKGRSITGGVTPGFVVNSGAPGAWICTRLKN